jgi:hypothetical protein
LATSWVKLLDEQGVSLRGKAVTGRRIEDLSGDGLAPPADAPPEYVVAHFRALEGLDYGAGKQADETSLRMLSRGFGNERSRFVLATNAIQTQLDLKQLDGENLPPEIVDGLVSDVGSTKMIAPMMKKVFAAFDDVPEAGRETYNGELLTETPDTRKVSFFDGVGQIMSGMSVSNPELICDVASSSKGPFGPDPKHRQRVASPDEIAIAEEVSDHLAAAFGALPEIVANTPIMALAQAAVMAKAMLTIVPENTAPGFDDRRRELLAAFFAPVLIGLTRSGWTPHPDKAIDLDAIEGGDSAA